MDEVYFEVISKFGKRIQVTRYRWNLIIRTKHPDIENKEKEVKETLMNPDEIRVSEKDSSVYLYYKKYGKLWVSVVAKHINNDSFIITTYHTDRIKEGELIYENKNE
ncbi:DUF4258 domain-containing protein [Candidatus Woesearchaeota archaeon]|nr:DUF4258 domain-containing protein [Candidatus Woesearchaeota archaeon]